MIDDLQYAYATSQQVFDDLQYAHATSQRVFVDLQYAHATLQQVFVDLQYAHATSQQVFVDLQYAHVTSQQVFVDLQYAHAILHERRGTLHFYDTGIIALSIYLLLGRYKCIPFFLIHKNILQNFQRSNTFKSVLPCPSISSVSVPIRSRFVYQV